MAHISLLSLLAVLVSVTLSQPFTQKLETKQWIPITIKTQNIIHFAIAEKQTNHVLKTNSIGYSFKFDNLPKWVDLVNGATIAGVPSSGASNLTLTYSDGNKNYSKTIYFSDT